MLLNKTHCLSRVERTHVELVRLADGGLEEVPSLPEDFTELGLGVFPGVAKTSQRTMEDLLELRASRVRILEENIQKRAAKTGAKTRSPKTHKRKKPSAAMEKTLQGLDPETAAAVKAALGL